MIRAIVFVVVMLSIACSGALAGGTIGGGKPLYVGVAYLEHCASCHGTSQPAAAVALFSEAWKHRVGDDPAFMATTIDAYIGPSHPPHGLSIAEAREIRDAIVCHHYPRSASCRKETP